MEGAPFVMERLSALSNSFFPYNEIVLQVALIITQIHT